MNLQFVTKTGADAADLLDGLAALRISVFREFPYLYEGAPEYEKEYLKVYTNAPEAFVFAVFDAGQMVGATTAIPLKDESEEVKRPFLSEGMSVDSIMYFGESLLLHPYRGLGIGHRFFDEREAHAIRHGYITTAFCAVERPADHPQRPAAYRPNDAFWRKRGYQKQAHLHTTFEWPDTGSAISTPKPMIFWLKQL